MNNKKIIGIVMFIAVAIIISIQFFITSSSNNPKDMTVEEYAFDYYDDYNVYRKGEDSLTLTLKNESIIVRCMQGPFRTNCGEMNSGTLLT